MHKWDIRGIIKVLLAIIPIGFSSLYAQSLAVSLSIDEVFQYVEADGDSIRYNISLTNVTNDTVQGALVSVELHDPHGVVRSIISEKQLNFLPFQNRSKSPILEVRDVAPAGEYTLYAFVGFGSDTTYSVNANFVKGVDLQSLHDSTLVAYWPFNGNADDESFFESNGTVFGAQLTQDRFGNTGAAYQFDGVDDYIDVGNEASLEIDLPLSMSFWAYLDVTTPSGFFVTDFNSDQYYGVMFDIHDGDGNPNMHYGDGGGIGSSSRRSKFATSVVGTGQWYHIVGVMRRETDMDIYIDGVDDGGTYSGTGGDIQYSSNSGSLGRVDTKNPDPETYFDGILDDIRIYNKALTYTEVMTLFNEPDPGAVTVASGPLMAEYSVPADFELSQNYPNPFNPSTEITFTLPSRSFVMLEVFDIKGSKIRELARTNFDAGAHTQIWNGTDSNGHQVSSGMYFYRIAVSEIENAGQIYSATKKMILIR